MSQIKVTLLIDIPDGATVSTPDVDYTQPTLEQLPPPAVKTTPTCPDHHKPMNFRPSGVSQRTGKPYGAFYGCPERDCKKTVDA